MRNYRKQIVFIFACFVAAGFLLIIYPEMSAARVGRNNRRALRRIRQVGKKCGGVRCPTSGAITIAPYAVSLG